MQDVNDWYAEQALELQNRRGVNRRLSEIEASSSVTPTNLASALLGTPALIEKHSRRRNAVDLPVNARRARRSSGVLERVGVSMRSLRDIQRRGIEKTQEREQEEKTKRVERYRNRCLFVQFCAEHDVNIVDATDDEVIDLSQQYDEAIADPTYKSQLLARSKKPRQSTARPRLTAEERLARLSTKPEFKMLCVMRTGQLPSEQETDALINVMEEYDGKSKQEREELAEDWKWCSRNPRAVTQLRKHLETDAFVDYCYNEAQTLVEDIEEEDLMALMREFVAL